MMTLAGYVVVTGKGLPLPGWCGTMTIYPDAEAAGRIARLHRNTNLGKQLGPLTTRPVELRVLDKPATEAQRTQR